MKLHSLKMAAFGPFADEVDVSFDKLDQGAPFLLTGPTGSGKTSILDAVCFALYGRIPRAGKSVPDVASRFRDANTEPWVEVEVTIGGERLRVRRTPSYERQKKFGEGKTKVPATAEMWNLDDSGQESICSNATEVNREVEERLRMTAEQFGQVVMLPQGEFSRFLRADAHERRHLLEQLFPGENLADVQDWLDTKAGEARNSRDEKRREIEDAITAAWSVVTETWNERDDEAPAKPDPLDATGLNETVKAVGEVLTTDRDDVEKVEKAAKSGWTKAEKHCTKLRERRRLVEQRGQNEDRREKLLLDSARIEEQRTRAEVGGRSAAVAPVAHSAAKRKETADQAACSRDELVAVLEADDAVASVESADLEVVVRGLRESETTLRNFEDTELPERRGLEQELTDLESLAGQLDSPGSAALTELDESRSEVEAQQDDLGEARARRLHIRSCRNAGMAAELAGGLTEGEPCVVCGSTEHPSPAHAEEGQEVFEKAEEDTAEEAVSGAEQALESAGSELAKIEAGVAKQKTETASKLNSCRTRIAAINAREGQLLDGASTVGERREAIGLLADRIDAALAAIETEVTARGAREQAVREASRAASENGFDSVDEALAGQVAPDELEATRSEIRRFDEDAAAINHRLDEGDLKEIDRREEVPLSEAELALVAASEAKDDAIEAATTCRNRRNAFVSNTGEIPSLLEELQPLTEFCDRVSGLAATATGKNVKRIQLCNFVLAARLKQVVSAANVKLGPMSGDRYALEYEEAADGRGPAGLGIRIFDSHISDERSTKTLSGGETFYCSLALALGLAEVVQSESGGRRLETLFIDEGFGTLDSETLNQVMNEIENLRADGRSVGLVSHVEEMRTRISAQIRVTPSRTGSELELVGV
jgi:exonuclease SbcC